MLSPEFLEKDRVYEFTIDLSHTGYTFSKGERKKLFDLFHIDMIKKIFSSSLFS